MNQGMDGLLNRETRSSENCLADYFCTYCIVASSNTSHFEAHLGLFKLSMMEIFDAYVLLTKS